MRHALLLLLLCAGLATGCTSSKPSPVVEHPELTAVEALRIYELYLTGQYEAYVAQFASCDRAPANYLRQMVCLMQFHASRQKKKMGGARSARVVRLQPSDDGRQVNAFVRVDYENQTHEEILLSFVYVGHRWRLR